MLDIQRRHAEVFRLRFGDKGKNGAPQKLTDRIRVTSPSRAVVQAFVDVFGGDVQAWNGGEGAQFEAYLPTTEIPIMVLPGHSIQQWWELYRGSVCERRCDGFTETLSGKACVCPSDITERMAATGTCRPMTRVALLVPDVEVVGAGSFVSHGMVAAETVPQAIAVAEAALQRGLMVPGVLRVVEHKGKRHYIVPQIEITGVSLRALATGEIPDALPAGARPELAPSPQPALPAAPADKPAKSKASKKASAPAAAQPPLPGETEDRLATDEQRQAVHDALAACDDDMRSLAADEWKDRVGPSLKAVERFTGTHAQAALDLIADVRKRTFDRRRRHVRAVLSEAGVTVEADVDAIVETATRSLGHEDLVTSSTAELSAAQEAAICEQLAPLIEARNDEPTDDPAEVA